MHERYRRSVEDSTPTKEPDSLIAAIDPATLTAIEARLRAKIALENAAAAKSQPAVTAQVLGTFRNAGMICGVDPSFIGKLVDQGRLIAIRLGSGPTARKFVRLESVFRLIDEAEAEAKAAAEAKANGSVPAEDES